MESQLAVPAAPADCTSPSIPALLAAYDTEANNIPCKLRVRVPGNHKNLLKYLTIHENNGALSKQISK